MDRDSLERELGAVFGGTDQARRVVARQAELGFELTVDAVIDNLEDAPEDYDLAERWNWWLDSLELSHGGYKRFRVRPEAVEE